MPIPEMAGGLVETRLLEALVTATRATRVLEIGTFTGVTALSIAERLPAGGVVITLEVDEQHAAIARRHFDASPVRDRIELVVGNALEIVDDARRPVPGRLHRRLEGRLPRVLRSGAAEARRQRRDRRRQHAARRTTSSIPQTSDEGTRALVAFADHVQADDRVDNALLTVADGLLLIWKRRTSLGNEPGGLFDAASRGCRGTRRPGRRRRPGDRTSG